MATLYDIKPAFQNLLRPAVRRLAGWGITANQVTVLAAVLSVGLGTLLCLMPERRALFLLLPALLFVRMALNAIDGMLAREHGQASKLGLYLNELCDLVSDMALALPFAFVPPFGPWSVLAFAALAWLAEVAGMLGTAAGIGRSYAGPLGKSDRAAALGALGLLVGLTDGLGAWAGLAFPLLGLLTFVTLCNRVRIGARS